MSTDGSHRSCQLCKRKATEPVLSTCCRANFCKKCMTVIIQDKKPCPKCGSRDAGSLQTKASQYSVDLEVSCDAGCGWVGEIDTINAHQQVWVLVEIECDVCEQDVKKKDMDKHFQNCLEKLVSCPKKCGLCFKRKDLDSHIKECRKQALTVADLKTKQEQMQQSIDQLTKQV